MPSSCDAAIACHQKRGRPFRFQVAWYGHKDYYSEIVKNAWLKNSGHIFNSPSVYLIFS